MEGSPRRPELLCLEVPCLQLHNATAVAAHAISKGQQKAAAHAPLPGTNWIPLGSAGASGAQVFMRFLLEALQLHWCVMS